MLTGRTTANGDTKMTVTIAGLHKDPFNDGHYYAALHDYDPFEEVLGPQKAIGKPGEDPNVAFKLLQRREGVPDCQIVEAFEVLEAETDHRPLRLRLRVEMVKMGDFQLSDEVLESPRFRSYRQMLEYFRHISAEHRPVWSDRALGWVSRTDYDIYFQAYYLDFHLVDTYNLKRPSSADCFHKESIDRAISLWDKPDVPVVPDQKIKLPIVEFSPLDETWVDDSDPEAFV